MRIGVVLPGLAVQREQQLDLATAARHVEDSGLDSVWHGDHLAPGRPVLDVTAAVATAAAVTRRVLVGTAVFVPAMRPLVWAAKQLATLTVLAGDRFVLGIGSGGGAAQWAITGMPYEERGPRTDRALALLPGLLAGRPTRLPDEPGQPTVVLEPAVTAPPIWIGNASPVARRRVARFGQGWFPSLVTPDVVAAGRADLHTLIRPGEQPPTIAIGLTGALSGAGPVPDRATVARGIAQACRRSAAEVAERLAAYAAAGASHAVVGIAGGDWRQQVDLMARTR